MNTPELLLHHQRLDQRARALTADIARLEARLARDPEAERLEAQLATTRAAREELAKRLRERERDVEDHRAHMKSREKQLMSGRINNPSELIALSQEVDHMKSAVAREEDAELTLMEEAEALDAELRRLEAAPAEGLAGTAAAAPELRQRLEQERSELAAVEAERAETWEAIPADFRAAYSRIRLADPVAEVVNNQCQGCRVTVTSSGMQQLRRHLLVTCEHCGRILVMA